MILIDYIEIETITSNTNPETGIKLEINSSSINLIDRIPSANKSARSIPSTVTPTPEPKAQANTINSIVTQQDTKRLLSATKIATIDLNALSVEPALANNNNCVQSNQPLIYDMFEDYPQPFTSNELTNSSNLVVSVPKKKKVFYKKNVRTSASNHRPPPAPKEKSKKPNKSELIENSSQYEPINNDPSIKKKLPKSRHDELDENISFDEDYEEEDRPNDQASALDLSQSTINLMHNTNDDPNELSVKFKSEFVKAVAEKVDLIYKKYNNLITQQENIIANSTKESIEQQTKNLNEQKNHFSEEMASVINFEDVSSNPELIKQLKQVYALLKQNGGQNTNQDRTKITANKANNNETLNLLNEIDSGKKKFDSIRSNADIREVFTIVNGLSKHNSIGSSERDAQLTFPPIANRGKAALNSLSQSSKAYKLPAILSDHIDKINTKIVPLSKLVSYFENQTNEEMLEANEAAHATKPPLPAFQFDSFKKKPNHADEKPKYNFVNILILIQFFSETN